MSYIGNARKPPELRQRRNKFPQLATVEPEARLDQQGVPPPPPDLLPEIAEGWRVFWEQSPLVAAMQVTDMPAVRRLFVLYNEWEWAYREMHTDPGPKPVRGFGEGHNDFEHRKGEWMRHSAAQGRLVWNPRGGLTLNPLIRYMGQLGKEITALEDRFGFNLQTRQKLGLIGLRARSLAEQNKAILSDDDRNDRDHDPRAALLQPAADEGGAPAP